MQTIRLVALAFLLFSLSLGSVFGAGYSPTTPTIVGIPLLGTSGAPALGGTNFAGVITVLYADGTSVVLETNKVEMNLCSDSSCSTVNTPLKQTAPGTYAYSFTVPSTLAGVVTIYVTAGGLADDNGRIFPSVDTSIGTYSTPSSSSSSTSAAQAQPGSPVSQEQSLQQLTRASVSQEQSIQPLTGQPVAPAKVTHQSPIIAIAVAVTVLMLTASGLLILPRRKLFNT